MKKIFLLLILAFSLGGCSLPWSKNNNPPDTPISNQEPIEIVRAAIEKTLANNFIYTVENSFGVDEEQFSTTFNGLYNGGIGFSGQYEFPDDFEDEEEVVLIPFYYYGPSDLYYLENKLYVKPQPDSNFFSKIFGFGEMETNKILDEFRELNGFIFDFEETNKDYEKYYDENFIGILMIDFLKPELILNPLLVDEVKKAKMETINGKSCQNYFVTMNKDRLIDNISLMTFIEDQGENIDSYSIITDICINTDDQIVRYYKMLLRASEGGDSFDVETKVSIESSDEKINQPEIENFVDHSRYYELLEEISSGYYSPKARDYKRISDIKQAQTAFELYYVRHDHYPTITKPVDIDGQANLFEKEEDGEDSFSHIMSTIPADPGNYKYRFWSDGEDYWLTFELENDAGGLKAGVNVATPSGIDEWQEKYADTDGDGLSQTMEKKWGTENDNNDTDGDGYLDGEEIVNGFNPNGSGKLEN